MPRMKSRRRLRTAFYLALLALLVWGAGQIVVPRPTLPARTGPALAEARTWGYQLQNVSPLAIPADVEVLVVDYSRDGTDRRAWDPEDMERLATGAGSKRRILLAYLSIGEAEGYRFYWRRHWRYLPPPWLGAENKEWKGNHAVQYWHPDWQRLVLDPGTSLLARLSEMHLTWMKPYLDRILEAGFDGVYLDRVDAFLEHPQRKSAEREMISFVQRISAYAKARKPGFLVVPQNGEELLRFDEFRRAIDGFAKEDLFYGIAHDETENPRAEVEKSAALLARARSVGLPVFLVEYVGGSERQTRVREEARRRGLVPLFAGRELNGPPVAVPPAAAGKAADGGSAGPDASTPPPMPTGSAPTPAAESIQPGMVADPSQVGAPRAAPIEPIVPPVKRK